MHKWRRVSIYHGVQIAGATSMPCIEGSFLERSIPTVAIMVDFPCETVDIDATNLQGGSSRDASPLNYRDEEDPFIRYAAMDGQLMTNEQSQLADTQRGSIVAAWVIAPFLVLYSLALCWIASAVWLTQDLPSFLSAIMLNSTSVTATLRPTTFPMMQQVVVSTCCAGLGGTVFMIRDFYINFAYGYRFKDDPPTYLRAVEIPRYLLLPFSAAFLGPVSLALLYAGAIVVFGGAGEAIPLYSVVIASFLFGFSYHDTLRALRRKSRQMFAANE